MEEIWPDEKKKKEFIPRTPVTRIIQCAPVYSENEVHTPRVCSRGRNSDKSLKSFPPCYSLSPIQLFLEIFYFFKLTQPLTVSVTEKGGKPDRKPYPLPYGLRNPYRNLTSENSQDYVQKAQRS
jgi:hypothetical protein